MLAALLRPLAHQPRIHSLPAPGHHLLVKHPEPPSLVWISRQQRSHTLWPPWLPAVKKLTSSCWLSLLSPRELHLMSGLLGGLSRQVGRHSSRHTDFHSSCPEKTWITWQCQTHINTRQMSCVLFPLFKANTFNSGIVSMQPRKMPPKGVSLQSKLLPDLTFQQTTSDVWHLSSSNKQTKHQQKKPRNKQKTNPKPIKPPKNPTGSECLLLDPSLVHLCRWLGTDTSCSWHFSRESSAYMHNTSERMHEESGEAGRDHTAPRYHSSGRGSQLPKTC